MKQEVNCILHIGYSVRGIIGGLINGISCREINVEQKIYCIVCGDLSVAVYVAGDIFFETANITVVIGFTVVYVGNGALLAAIVAGGIAMGVHVMPSGIVRNGTTVRVADSRCLGSGPDIPDVGQGSAVVKCEGVDPLNGSGNLDGGKG